MLPRRRHPGRFMLTRLIQGGREQTKIAGIKGQRKVEEWEMELWSFRENAAFPFRTPKSVFIFPAALVLRIGDAEETVEPQRH